MRYTIIGLLILSVMGYAVAQETDEACTPALSEAVEAAQAACSELVEGERCSVEEDSAVTLLEDGGLRFILFGEASLEAIEAEAEPATLNVSNGVGYAVNLRAEPSTIADVLGSFNWNQTGIADGRSADNVWVRLQRDSGPAWVSAELVRLDGAIDLLPIADGKGGAAFNLQTEPEDCTDAAGLLLESTGEDAVQVSINKATLELDQAAALITPDEDGLTIRVLSGEVAYLADEPVTATAGQTLLAPQAELPSAVDGLILAQAESAPLTLTSQAICLVAPNADSINLLTEPDSDAETVLALEAGNHYQAAGYAEDATGERWLQLRSAGESGWVAESDILAVGNCAELALIDPNAMVTGGGSNSAAIANVLSGRSIWQANSGNESSTGTCNFPPVAMCEHPVAITPNADGTISWRGQEPEPYTMYPGDTGFFSYAGRNKLNNAELSLALTIQGEGAWRMTMTQVFDNDPQCIRTFYYTATRVR